MAPARRTLKAPSRWRTRIDSHTAVAPYSLRGLPYPTVSMPITWDELEVAVRTENVDSLVFRADDVPPRLEQHGDLFAPLRPPTAAH